MVPAGLPSQTESPYGAAIQHILVLDSLNRASRPISLGFQFARHALRLRSRTSCLSGKPYTRSRLRFDATPMPDHPPRRAPSTHCSCQLVWCVRHAHKVVDCTAPELGFRFSRWSGDEVAMVDRRAWEFHRNAEWGGSPGTIRRDAGSRSSGPGMVRMAGPSGLPSREGSPAGTIEPENSGPAYSL
jgi:hypothetical protein